MATDCDRYAVRLGRGFARVRALLCSPTEVAAGIERAAAYLERRAVRDDEDFPGLVRLACQHIERRKTWLFPEYDPDLDRFTRNETRSLPAFHVLEAMHGVISTTCDPRDLLPEVVNRGIDAIKTCARLQRDYKGDHVLHAALDEHTAAIGTALLRRHRARFEIGRVEAAPADGLRGDQTALLGLVISVTNLERAR